MTVRPWERQLFLRCRRAWDFAARERGNWEPTVPSRVFDYAEAVRDALAVYYFPGMWDWNRAIVLPLASEGFMKSMRRQRAAYEEAAGELSAAQAEDWEAHLQSGLELLADYYPWAAQVDRFTSLQVEPLFDVLVPDPDHPEMGLLAPDGEGFRYRTRVDLVVIDDRERQWIVDHRVVTDWTAEHDLLLDDQLMTRTWAWKLHFLGRPYGTITNELRLTPGPEPAAPARKLSRLVTRQETARFRRTRIIRRKPEMATTGRRVAQEMLDLWRAARDDRQRYPNPGPARCASCAHQLPCRALDETGDPSAILADAYRCSSRPDFEEGRLGSVWGFVAHRADHERVRQDLPPPSSD